MRQVFKIVMAAVLIALLSLGSVARGFAQGGAGRPFITKWQGKAGEELKLPIVGTDYKLVIKDDKGKVVKTEEKVTVTGEGEDYYHPFTPTADGVYTVEAGPAGVKRMQMRVHEHTPITSNDQLLEVVQFGTVAWESMSQMFYFCRQMTFAAGIDIPDLTKVTDMSRMFHFCNSFNQPLEKWDVSKVTDMHMMFFGCLAFNQPLEKWDVSNVTDMSEMFLLCGAFNQLLEKWNVSNVTDMRGMFAYCNTFNQPLEKWVVSNVTNMHEMFGARAFNQPLEKWDVSKVTNMSEMFLSCEFFNQPLEKWNVSKVTNMSGMFADCKAFNQPLNSWDVSNVTDMHGMFKDNTTFNQPLEKWDVSKVTNMSEMFAGNKSFTHSLAGWDVSKVTDMSGMFKDNTTFNRPLEKWNVGKVTNMSKMFYECRAFNQPLEKWDVSNVTDMSKMFAYCFAFNQPLEKWDVSNVTDMNYMFAFCSSFNQPLNNWNVDKVTDMSWMFYVCTSFNQPLEKWDVSKVTNMSKMFNSCNAFNQPLNNWNVGKVTDMSKMFDGCNAFNQPLNNWNVGKVTNMSKMFAYCSAFNQPLNSWDVSQVTDMSKMFDDCTAFNQPLENWDVSNVTDMSWMFYGCKAFNQPLGAWKLRTAIDGLPTTAMSVENYSQSLIGWAKQTDGARNIEMWVQGLIYNDAGKEAREKLIERGWRLSRDVYQPSEKVAITLVKEGEGTLAIEGYNEAALQKVAVGTELTVTATPNDGYTLTSLTAGTQDILATKKFTVKEAMTVRAVFKKKVAISLAKEGEGTLAIEGYNDEALQAVTVGTELTVTATPKAGYMLTSLMAGTQDILATKKFTVTEAVTVKAVFKKTVAITLAKEGEGTLAIKGYSDAALQAVAEGTELTVITTPKAGYLLTSLMAGTQNILATKKFTVTGAVTVKAVFKTIEEAPKVAITLVKEGEGTLAIEGYNEAALQKVAVGTELTVTATPNDGYTLTSLTAGAQNILATKKFIVTGALTVKAVFKKKENNGGNNGGGWQPPTPKAVEDAVLTSLAVAPNPVTSQLRIENPEGIAVRYELVNASGLVMRSGAFAATEVFVDTEALPAGLYFVRITAQNGAKRVEKVFKY